MQRPWLLAVVLLLGACSSDDPPTKATGDVCYVASDCPDPLVCAYQKCRTQCLSNKDCPTKHHCVGATQPRTGVCLPDEDCTRNSDCSEPLVCGRRSLCEEQCGKDVDCLASQICDRGSCADVTVAPEAGVPLTPGTSGQTCNLNSDCEPGLVCLPSLSCGKQCVEARDCRAGERCVANLCVTSTAGPSDAGGDTPPGYGAPCAYPSDCLSPLVCRPTGVCAYECVAIGDCRPGEVCNAAHNCIVPPDGGVDTGTDSGGPEAGKPCVSSSECDDGVYCNGYERCVAGRCMPPLEGPCDSHSSCVKDSCEEATKKCTHVTVTTIDADGDGHASLACGGDDCNDKDGTIYKGAPELCDLKDNDCNGVIDNDTVQPRGSTVEFTLTPARTKMLVATLGGKFLVVTSEPTAVYARTLDLAGTSSAEVAIASGKTNVSLLGIATSGDVAAVLFDAYDPSQHRRIALIRPDLTGTKITTLSTATFDGVARDGGVAWNGTRFLAAWSQSYSGTTSGHYTMVEKDGTTTGGIRFLPTYGDAALYFTTMQAAADSANVAVAYSASPGWHLATFSALGDKVAGPVLVAKFPSIATTTTSLASGFLTFVPTGGKHDVYPVSNALVVGTPVSVPFIAPLDALGMSNAVAIAGKNGVDPTLRFGYSSTGIEGTFEYNSPMPVSPATTDVIRLAALPGQQIGLFYLAAGGDKKLYYRRIGCAP
jgi:hypothetical protein